MAKSKPTVVANGKPAAPLSPLDVLTLAEAAAYLRLPEDAVREEAEAGRHVRGEWRFSREAVGVWLRTPCPDARARPLAAAGYLDDHTLEPMIEGVIVNGEPSCPRSA